jgi:hypothetical protein
MHYQAVFRVKTPIFSPNIIFQKSYHWPQLIRNSVEFNFDDGKSSALQRMTTWKHAHRNKQKIESYSLRTQTKKRFFLLDTNSDI